MPQVPVIGPDIERFRRRAELCRAEAELTREPGRRQERLETARAYERMAERATYQISSDGSITLHIIGSTFPNWDGTKQKRLAAIKGDEIIWTNPTPSMGGNTVITLQRAKSGERYPQREEK